MPLPVCRVCLSSNIVTVNSVTDIQLRDIYEKLTGTQLRNEDNLPEALCFYCCWQLQQFCKLRATALYSDEMLRKVLGCNTKHGLRYINSLPKSRRLSITTLKSFSFNGESNEITFEYPRQMMMNENDQPKPIFGSQTDYIREKPDKISTVNKPSVNTFKKTPVNKQYDPISKQLSLQCLLTGKPGLVITEQKELVVTRNTGMGKQEAQINEIKHKTGELRLKIQDKRPENQDLVTGNFNVTEKHEMNLKVLKQSWNIEAVDDNSQSGDAFEHPEINTVSEMDKIVSETKPPILFFCDICEKLFQNYEKLSEHQQTHKISKKTSKKRERTEHQQTHKISKKTSKKRERTPCPICKKYVMDMRSHKIVHCEKKYVCDICGHMSQTKANLATHLRVHMDEPEIVCEVCNKGFKFKSSYIYHKNIHTGERPFSCHICGRKYKQSGQVRAHIRSVHEGIKRFCCDLCGKKFDRTAKLLDHLNAHANIKPYSCDKCQKVFTNASVMRRHVARYCKVNK